MHKLILTLIAMMVTTAAFAAETPVSGTSKLKLEDNPVRSVRKAIESIDKEIKKLDKEILEQKNLSATYKAMPNNGLRASQMEALANANQLQRDELLKKRDGLQESLKQ